MTRRIGLIIVCMLVVVAIVAGYHMNWFKKTTPEEQFWQWFAKHDDDLFSFERNREPIFDQLNAELGKINKDLTFEFGPVNAGKREFVISAAGLRRAFPSVIALADKAPLLPRWTIIKFRPRRFPIHDIEYDGSKVRANEVQFAILSNGKILGIYLFIPGYSNERHVHWGQIGYLFLDEALGEYDVETKVGLIKCCPLDAYPEAIRHPLPELPRLFDEMSASLTTPSNGPKDQVPQTDR